MRKKLGLALIGIFALVAVIVAVVLIRGGGPVPPAMAGSLAGCERTPGVPLRAPRGADCTAPARRLRPPSRIVRARVRRAAEALG